MRTAVILVIVFMFWSRGFRVRQWCRACSNPCEILSEAFWPQALKAAWLILWDGGKAVITTVKKVQLSSSAIAGHEVCQNAKQPVSQVLVAVLRAVTYMTFQVS